MNYKKSSKKSNIPVSPARDKFNTILLILMFGSIITLVVLSFLAAVMSSYGRFQEGMSGLLIGTFLTRIAYCLCMLSIPVILYKKVVKNKILRGGLIFVVLLIVFFTFRNPVSVTYLPHTEIILDIEYKILKTHKKYRYSDITKTYNQLKKSYSCL